MENRKIGAEEKRARKGATLESIHAFRQKFMPGEADPDALAASINEAHTRVKGDFVNISLAVAVETAEKLGPAGNLHLETVLSVLDGTIMDDPYYRMVFQPGADPSDPRDPDS
jgi:hypothetical protein